MGMDKALLPVAGVPSYQHVARKLSEVAEDIWVVRRPDQEPVPTSKWVMGVVHDLRPGEGPLAGMEAGLSGMNNDWGMVVPADAPLIRSTLLHMLTSLVTIESSHNLDIQAYVLQKRGQVYPLFGCYRQGVLQEISGLLDNGNRRVKDLLDQIHVRYVTDHEWHSEDPEEVSFWMMNTPEEYRKVCEYAEGAYKE